MKKVIGMGIALMVLMVAPVSRATVVFSDNAEGDTLGGTAVADIGTWNNNTLGQIAKVTDAATAGIAANPSGGTQFLEMSRSSGGNSQGLANGIAAGGSATAGTPVKMTWDMYVVDVVGAAYPINADVFFVTSGWPSGGHPLDETYPWIRVRNTEVGGPASVYEGTSFNELAPVSLDAWHSYELNYTVGDASSMFFTLDGGTPVNIPAPWGYRDLDSTADVAGVLFRPADSVGNGSQYYVDNVLITYSNTVPQEVTVTVPDPFLCMYGHYDGPGVTEEFRKFIPPFTVIEGTSGDAIFIKELRAQGRVYAAHVNNLPTSTTAQLVAAWRAPFDNSLGGQLPGGYDAIAIDEFHAATTDGTTQSGRVIAALQQLRALYPDKLVFVAAVWQYAQMSENYVDLLNAINTYADMLMLEKYMREGNLSYWSVVYADKLKTAVPGILNKAVFGLYISQHGFIADDRSDVGYWGILDEQFHRIRNDGNAATMPGLMFWAYYRSETKLTPDYCARLCDHYYVQGNTDYFGDGLTTQQISNPGFDVDTSGWVLTPGAGGTLARVAYSAEGVRDTHSADPIRNLGQGPVFVSHESHGLKMRRGSTHNRASYQIAVNPGMTYTVSAWVLANADNNRAQVTITESDGTYIESEEISHAGTYDYARIAFSFAPPSSPIQIVLNDETTVPGTVLYWDFVEMEDAYPMAASGPSQDVPVMVSPVGNTARLGFSSDLGVEYGLEWSTNWTDWIPAGFTLTGSGSPMYLFHPSGADNRKAYRLVSGP